MIALLRSLRMSSTTNRTCLLSLARASSTINTTTCEAAGAGDPAVHSGEPPEDSYPEKPPKFSGAEEHLRKDQNAPDLSSTTTPLPRTKDAKEKTPPFSPSQKLESHEVIPPDATSFQQKRRRFSTHVAALDEVSCVGTDGSLQGEEVSADVEEYRRYYAEHKPSLLSEIEVADTRKPITRAMNGSASDRANAEEDGRTGLVVEETVDDALARAERLFREKAQRGDPEWPHSRALERMLMERAKEEGGLHSFV